MKKKLAFSIASATAAVIGGWKLVQQIVDRGDDVVTAPASTSPATGATKPPPGAKPKPAAPSKADAPDNGSSKTEIYEIATGLGIKGRSKMSKQQLLEAIQEAS